MRNSEAKMSFNSFPASISRYHAHSDVRDKIDENSTRNKIRKNKSVDEERRRIEWRRSEKICNVIIRNLSRVLTKRSPLYSWRNDNKSYVATHSTNYKYQCNRILEAKSGLRRMWFSIRPTEFRRTVYHKRA